MKFILLVVAFEFGSAIAADAQATVPPGRYDQGVASASALFKDGGGASARPYYPVFNPQQAEPTPAPSTTPTPRISSATDAEAAMLPVRSVHLTPGVEPRRPIRAPGLTPLFLIGDDDRSRAWLRQRRAALQTMHAVGLVVNVATPEALAALRRLAPGLMLSPVPGDDLAQRLGIQHYPVLITATGIEP